MVFPIPYDVEGRVTFCFIVSPLADPQVSGDFREFGMNILFGGLFSINCVADRSSVPLPPTLRETFVFMSPAEGPLEGLALSEDQASILFHQRLSGVSFRPILYPPNRVGVYRIVFAVEMRDVPEVHVRFADPQYVTEFICVTRASAWFKVQDRKGNVVKHEVPLTSIELNAEI